MARGPVLEVRHLNSYYRQDHSCLLYTSDAADEL